MREKKRSTQTSLLFSKKLCVKIFTSCGLMQIIITKKTKKKHNEEINHSRYKSFFSLTTQYFFAKINYNKKKEKKNGAHKHLSLFSKTSASKYSRHVVLCK